MESQLMAARIEAQTSAIQMKQAVFKLEALHTDLTAKAKESLAKILKAKKELAEDVGKRFDKWFKAVGQFEPKHEMGKLHTLLDLV